MASARRSFHRSVEPMLRELYWCACHQPSTTPGTVSAAGPPGGGEAPRDPPPVFPFDRAGAGRASGAAEGGETRRRRVVDQPEVVAAHAVHVRVDDGDGGRRGDGGVQRIAAPAKGGYPTLACQQMRRADHAAGGARLEPASLGHAGDSTAPLTPTLSPPGGRGSRAIMSPAGSQDESE